jgi:outer membrane protein OmpA-like peptidoglycan-associated protein
MSTGTVGSIPEARSAGVAPGHFGQAIRDLASMAGIDSILPDAPRASPTPPTPPTPALGFDSSRSSLSPQTRDSRPEVPAPSQSPDVAEETVASTFRSVPSTSGGNGGWVAPDHRRTRRQGVLISLERANRTPSVFFGSEGRRRVYVPTDPIFEHATADVSANGELQLTRLAALLNLHPEQKIGLDVHTDAAGAPATQRRLSEHRAAALRGWLVDRGHLDAARLQAGGVGGVHPIVPPDGSYAEQQPNRRIEIRLVE